VIVDDNVIAEDQAFRGESLEKLLAQLPRQCH
jgi:hypothetical protein